MGRLPERYNDIRDALQREQREAGGKNAEVDDIFDIPVELAKVITSYRYDEPVEAISYAVLLSKNDKVRKQKRWWKFSR